MVYPTVLLASKIPDKSLQFCAVSLLAGTDIIELRYWIVGLWGRVGSWGNLAYD